MVTKLLRISDKHEALRMTRHSISLAHPHLYDTRRNEETISALLIFNPFRLWRCGSSIASPAAFDVLALPISKIKIKQITPEEVSV